MATQSSSHETDTGPAPSDISPLIVSSIHEIKNQFSILLLHIEDILNGSQQNENNDTAAKLRGEVNFISHRLSEMLGSYKSQNFSITPNIDQHALEELFDDIAIHHTLTETSYDLTIRYECNEDMFGFFDEHMIQNIINTAVYNSAQTKVQTQKNPHTAPVSEILISAHWDEEKQNGDSVTIFIEDDGPGYPDSMLQNSQTESTSTDLKVEQMKTGLGLYLAHQIAQAHTRNGKQGHIELLNGRTLSGACLAIHLP